MKAFLIFVDLVILIGIRVVDQSLIVGRGGYQRLGDQVKWLLMTGPLAILSHNKGFSRPRRLQGKEYNHWLTWKNLVISSL